jgi:hypothetical protein
VLDNKSLLEILANKKKSLDHLRIFECIYFVHIKRHDKFDKNALKIIFLGYSSKQKGYKYFNPIENKLHISRNVRFFENEPSFKEGDDINKRDFIPTLLLELIFFLKVPTHCCQTLFPMMS